MIAEQSIPVYTTLSDVFGSLTTSLEHVTRWNNLAEEFEKRFGRKPTYIARAPGRVNLIGEHIDYALFGVLPAAIEQDILIACAPRLPHPQTGAIPAPGSVVAENLHHKYTRQSFTPASTKEEDVSDENVRVEGWHLDINTNELRWESYVKAGYYGVLNHHFTGKSDVPIPVDLLVTGSIPAGSGLSSSAAMVVASTLAFLAVNGKLEKLSDVSVLPVSPILNKGELVQLAMENEKRVGVNSGGMDQAASVMSDPSSALYITFYPTLTASAVPLPVRAVFVCANSLVVADKASSAKRGYNLRVVETLVAARILANSLGFKIGDRDRITLRQVAGKLAGEVDREDIGTELLEQTLVALENKLEVLKPNGSNNVDEELGLTMTEMIEKSGLPGDVFHEVYLSWVEIEATYFQLYKRTKQVLSEARRVLQFRQTCLLAAKSFDADDDSTVLEGLGRLMNDSQSSCSLLYECSCPKLDNLTRLAREAGAYGSRLTGAGWGGCTISLVAENNVDDFVQRLKETYPPYKNLEEDALREVIFATKPGSGACVFKLET
jgi:galactokinase